MIRNRKDLADEHYSWCYGTDKWALAFARYSVWIEEKPSWSWWWCNSLKEKEDEKVRHITFLGINFGIKF